MIKVYQTIMNKEKGNCMQAVVASLFNMGLNDVPKFIEMGDKKWIVELDNFFEAKGYRPLRGRMLVFREQSKGLFIWKGN